MVHRPTVRLLGAAVLSAALATAATPATGSAPPELRAAPEETAEPSVVRLGDGSRVQLTPATGERTAVQPLPRRDGTTPGLFVASDGAGTTVQATDATAPPTAIAGEPAVTTRVAEGGLVELRLEAIGRDGRPAHGFVTIDDVAAGGPSAFRRLSADATDECSASSWEESTCLLVPPGTYSVMAFISTNPAGVPSEQVQRTTQSLALLGDPELEVTGSTTHTLDAREARPVEVRTPGHRTSAPYGGWMEVRYTRTTADGRALVRDLYPTALLDQTAYVQPMDPVTTGQLDTLVRLRLEAPDIELSVPGRSVTPDYYDPVWFSDFASDFPMYDGSGRHRVVDAGRATAADLAGLDLRGAIAVVERSDDLSVAEQSNAAAKAGAVLVAIANDGPGDNDDPNGTGTMLQVPTVRLSRAEGRALTTLPPRALVGVTGEPASPYLYDLVIKERGGVPGDLSYTFDRDDLARQVRQVHGQPTIRSTFSEAAYHYQPGDSFSTSTMFPFRGGPRERVEYRIPDPDTAWTYAVGTPELPHNFQFPHEPVHEMFLSGPKAEPYTSTAVVTTPVARAPITSRPSAYRPVERSGDWLRIAIDGFVDADGNHGSAYSGDSGMRTLLQVRANGELVGETEYLPSGIAALPPGESVVELSFRTDNPQSWNELSTHTETTWTFPSRTVDEGVEAAPVILADYDVDVDLRNRLTTRGRAPELDLALAYAVGKGAALIDDVSLEVSYDDGATWRPARLDATGEGRHHAVLPPGTGFASLRLRAADGSGAVLEQTLVRAFLVR